MSIYIALCMLLFVVMMVLPFVPGWLEMRRKRDIKHLYINGDFVRDPRYFSTSFKRKLLHSAGSLAAAHGKKEIMLSKKELLVQADKLSAHQTKFDHVVWFKEQPKLQPNCVFQKELYAQKDIALPAGSLLRAAACENNCYLGKESRVIRWIDAEKQLEIAENCRLDLSATAGERLMLGKGCSFRRLYAPVIIIGGGAKELPLPPLEVPETNGVVHRDVDHIESGQTLIGDVIAKGDFTMQAGAVLVGSLKVYGKLLLAEGAQIQGSVFGEKKVELLGSNWIRGSVFSQGSIEVGSGCTFGRAQVVESVIARHGITFSSSTTIYGFVLTEGEGATL